MDVHVTLARLLWQDHKVPTAAKRTLTCLADNLVLCTS